MKGIVIVGKSGEREIRRLADQLKENLGAREYVPEDEMLWPAPEEPRFLQFRKGTRQRRLPLEQILYLEKQLRKISVVLENRERISFYSGMKEVMEQLGKDFCQCHKSYAVNLDKVAALEEEGFRMTDGSLVPIGQRRRRESRWAYEDFQEQKNIEKLRFSKSFSCFEI